MERVNIRVKLALALSAASALIYEIVVTSVLFFYFAESSYSLATVLSVFLFGLGLGSLLVYFTSHKIKNKSFLFGSLQIIIAVYAFFVLTNIQSIISKISTLGTFFTSFLVLLVPTVFLGAIFPLAASMIKDDKRETVGLVYSWDLFGAIIGSLIAGFFLIPEYGARLTTIVAGALNLFSAFLIFNGRKKVIPVLFAVLLLAVAFVSAGFIDQKYNEYQFYSHSPYGVVKVKDSALYINERQQCAMSYPKDTSEREMVNFGLDSLINKGHLEVLNIGLGCGLTVERTLEYNADVDVVEINPKVVEANRIMTDILDREGVNLIVEDGLKYLRDNNKLYDSILIDIEDPSAVHSSNLYTVEAFEIVEKNLNEGGTFVLWNYEFIGNERYVDIIYYSLKESFNHVYGQYGVFIASNAELGYEEYAPKTDYEVNTVDRRALTKEFDEDLFKSFLEQSKT